ncbi:MAG: hypothetical protein ACXAEF_14835 [Candidatus Thorarchaeota archaeon]|jgi:hypothetical protein
MKYGRSILIFSIAALPIWFVMRFLVGFVEADVILIFPLSAIIGTLIGCALAPVFLGVYKKFYGKKHLFAIQDPETIKLSHGISTGFFPALMATNFAMIVVLDSNLMEMLLGQEYSIEFIVFPFFLLCALLQAPAFALFTAAWIIDESGIVTMSKYGATELQATGKWFLAFLKGYAGISVIISLYQLVFAFIEIGAHFSVPMFLFIFPLLGMALVIPATMLVAATVGRRRRYILGYAERFGIRTEFELSVRIFEENQEALQE